MPRSTCATRVPRVVLAAHVSCGSRIDCGSLRDRLTRIEVPSRRHRVSALRDRGTGPTSSRGSRPLFAAALTAQQRSRPGSDPGHRTHDPRRICRRSGGTDGTPRRRCCMTDMLAAGPRVCPRVAAAAHLQRHGPAPATRFRPLAIVSPRWPRWRQEGAREAIAAVLPAPAHGSQSRHPRAHRSRHDAEDESLSSSRARST